MNYKDFFNGKRVTMLGLGLLGRGVGDAAFIAEQGAQLLVTDKKSAAELRESTARLTTYPTISFRFGIQHESDFTNADMVIKAAGVPLDSPYIAAARAADIPVYMSTALAARFAKDMGAIVVGVTGTRGKSTVAHMIYHALIRAGTKAHLGGNVRGVSTLALVPNITKDDVLVLELDSWQLQGFGDLELSPAIALFTNLMPDHLNYYSDMEKYFSDKANIFKYQNDSDTLIIGSQLIAEHEDHLARVDLPLNVIRPTFPGPWHLKIPGVHNKELATLAAAALKKIGLSDEEITDGLESFGGVEGRLQFVREVKGVKIYNDNNATTPEATIAALRALDTGSKNIILIMGGSDKGLDMKALWNEIQHRCKDLYFLAGTGIDRIRTEAPHVPAYASIPEVLSAALDGSAPGDILLFSPAFASFGMFKNEYERNDLFLQAVSGISE